LRGELKLAEDAVLCFTAARLHGVKGFQYQLKAMPLLMSRPIWPRLHFAWAGTGPSEGDIRGVIQQLGFGEHIHLLGERHDVAQWLEAADIFLLPSVYEGMPLAIMEAMAKGLPVAASAVSGIPEELGDTGHLLPSPQKNSDATVAALAKIVETWGADSALRSEVGAAGRRRACEMFAEERMLRETMAAISNCLPENMRLAPGQAPLPAATKTMAKPPTSSGAGSRKESKIVIDGVFFQTGARGAGRVWAALLEEWSGTPFGTRLIILDRERTAPRLKGLKYREIAKHSYANTSADRALLQAVCNEEKAAAFISTYFTAPLTTPSLFLLHDMVAEAIGADLNSAEWREKHFCLKQASAFVCVSHNTARDLARFCSHIPLHSITVAYNGIKEPFTPAGPAEIAAFKKKYRLEKPYYLLVGERKKYKNALLFFEAFAALPDQSGVEIVCVGKEDALEKEFRQHTAGTKVHLLQLEDDELRLAYAGALALAYPSRYEGFGLCVLEALACGCPVITCWNSSIPEVAADAALYVPEDGVEEMSKALVEVRKPKVRETLSTRGLDRARLFSWRSLTEALPRAVDNLIERSSPRLIAGADFEAEAAKALQAFLHTPASRALQQRLREIRRRLAHFWLQTEDAQRQDYFSGRPGALQRFWLEKGLSYLPPDETEAAFVEALRIGLNLAYNTARERAHLLALLLYLPPHALALQFKRLSLPGWLLSNAIRWFSAPPLFFREPGEGEIYFQHLRNWLATLSRVPLSQPETPLAGDIARAAVENLNLSPLLLASAPQPQAAALRAQLLELALRSRGHKPACEFPLRPQGGQSGKMRLGILHTQFIPNNSTTALLPVFEELDRGQFEVCIFALAKGDEVLEEDCKRAGRFAILPENLAEAAKMVRDEALDVLILGGENWGQASRFVSLAAHRLARLQIAAPGLCCPQPFGPLDGQLAGKLLGSSAQPVLLTSQSVPPRLELDGAGFCFSRVKNGEPANRPTRQQLRLSAQAPVFISFVQAALAGAELAEAWAKILAEVPNASLVLALIDSVPLETPHMGLQVALWDRIFSKYGVEEERPVLLNVFSTPAEMRAHLRLADVCLDAFPASNPCALACALEAGIPAVALQGPHPLANSGAAILSEAGLAEFAAASEADYIKLAARLGRDELWRRSKHQEIRAKISRPLALFDSGIYAKQIETALLKATRS
jgi:glycosyltransferase involved in cell wall biosynthesis